ncbi:MAG: RHS repeat-associated core domain-containing protein [Flavobacteriales bacterium]|nr:RHS repeat-associated core domain-containing protein [Flavobacteriales bacterium]
MQQNTQGNIDYEITNYLGNVNVVISDRKIWNITANAFKAVPKNYTDYFPFGMEISSRTSVGTYRYGYNGMEQDPEAKGEGNSYTTEFRQYDPRLGRWLSLDPLASSFPWQSPYCAFDNNPVLLIDPTGLSTGDPPPGWAEENGCEDPEEGTLFISKKTGPFSSPSGEMMSGTGNEGVFDDKKLKAIAWVYADKESDTWLAVGFETQAGEKYSWNADKNYYVDSKGNEFDDCATMDLTNMVGGAVTPAVQSFIDHNEKNDAFYSFKKALAAHKGGLASFVWDGFKKTISDIGSGGHRGTQALGSMYMGFLSSGNSLGLTNFGTIPILTTTKDGYLLGKITFGMPFSIDIQRFGAMSANGLDYWSPTIFGSSRFAARTFNAIKPEWNNLSVYTTGRLPKGTQVTLGIIGWQGVKHPGGLIQFQVKSKLIKSQTSIFN